jgi:hypothetical protein
MRPEVWAATGLLGVLTLGTTIVLYQDYSGRFERKTARSLVLACTQAGESDMARPLFFVGSPPYSASFYSAGRARGLRPQDPLPSVPLGPRGLCLALPAGNAFAVPRGFVNAGNLGRFGAWDLHWLRAQGG